MFKDTDEGQTHSYNDGCGDPEHNKESTDSEDFPRRTWQNRLKTLIKEQIITATQMVNAMNPQTEAELMATVMPNWHIALHEFVTQVIEEEKLQAVTEYRQFIWNVLDGVDKADEEMGNKGGGTKAIRLAINSRLI